MVTRLKNTNNFKSLGYDKGNKRHKINVVK